MKALLGGELRDDPVDGSFEGGGGSHVDDPSTAGAEQVVVMFGQIFCELESSELVARCDAPDHPGGLKID